METIFAFDMAYYNEKNTLKDIKEKALEQIQTFE